MSQEQFISVGGHNAQHLYVLIPPNGPWVAEAVLDDKVSVSGQVTVVVGKLSLQGTVDPRYSGDFSQQRKVRIVAGGNGWGTTLKARHYHDDGIGVKHQTLVQDLIRESGETAGTIDLPGAVGADYVRPSGLASTSMHDVCGTTPWWVGTDGKTYVGQRNTSKLDPKKFDLLNFDSALQIAEITAEDLSVIQVGSIITSDRLDAPKTIREIEIQVNASSARVYARCSDDQPTQASVAGAIRALAQQALGGVGDLGIARVDGEGPLDATGRVHRCTARIWARRARVA